MKCYGSKFFIYREKVDFRSFRLVYKRGDGSMREEFGFGRRNKILCLSCEENL